MGETSVIGNALLSLAASLLVTAASHAQPPSSNTLTKNGDTYTHEPSKSSVKIPKEWEIIDTKGGVNQPHLALRRPYEGVDVLVSWTRLQDIKFDEAVEIELNQLVQTYGKEKVAKREPLTVENKSVSVIEISDGPDRNGKQVGFVYLLDAGPDARERWKVKIRVILTKATQAEGQKLVSALLQQFQW
jgi:hypothetical protein